jgi:hypothetical protein
MSKITFDSDNFAQRRASQKGAGVAYDPESLITGEEVAAGLTYHDKRDWFCLGERNRQAAHQGLITPEDVALAAPRRKADVLPDPISGDRYHRFPE